MSIFYPTVMLPEISEITPHLLKKLGVSALILDIDNTLAPDGCAIPDKKALRWLASMKKHGYPVTILSNNRTHRVRSFALRLGVDYTANAMKPLPKGFREIARRWGRQPGEIALVGDQIFTDVLGANLFGCKCILISPLREENNLLFLIKRWVEKRILHQYGRENRA